MLAQSLILITVLHLLGAATHLALSAVPMSFPVGMNWPVMLCTVSVTIMTKLPAAGDADCIGTQCNNDVHAIGM